MNRLFAATVTAGIASAFKRLKSLRCTEPALTPENWSEFQPCMTIRFASRDVILSQPSSTLFVYSLGILMIGVGLNFLWLRGDQVSRSWWGISLLLWGIGVILAGTSYQAFGYHIKCAGQETCAWTSWWEVIYLMLSVASVDAMMAAGAYCCIEGKWRKGMPLYALAHVALYSVIVLVGALVPIKLLISFELLLVVAAPNILLLLGLNGWRYYKLKDPMDLALLGTWLWLGVTLCVYFIYLVLDVSQAFWAQGVWFSENDVLHIGLILWMIYVGLVVAKRVVDSPATTLAS